jgi:hypothetical protein
MLLVKTVQPQNLNGNFQIMALEITTEKKFCSNKDGVISEIPVFRCRNSIFNANKYFISKINSG